MPGCSARARAVSAAMSSTRPFQPRRAEVAVAIDGAGGASVAAVVVGVHDVAGVDERLAEPAVAGGVLAHPVGDLHDGLRVAVARPAVDEHLLAVGALDRERRLFHRARTVDLTHRSRRPLTGHGSDDVQGPEPTRWSCRPCSRRRADVRQLGLAIDPASRQRHDPLPGVVHITGWLDADRQRQLVADFRRWAVPPAGLRHPRVPSGHLMSVQSVCLGWHWQPYAYSRTADDTDGAPVKPLPADLAALASEAVADTFGAVERRSSPTRRSSTSTRPVPASACTRTARSRRRRRS